MTNFDQASCGYGVQVNGDDGGIWVYCHASARSLATGTRVSAGTQLGLTGGKPGATGSGDSTGPHLHVQVKSPTTTLRCPQNLLLAIYNRTSVPSLSALPTTGCYY